MIGLDTNVLVRYIAQDDATQSAKASALIESLTADYPGYITQVALVELVWVLGSLYAAGRDDITRVIESLLRTRELTVESAEIVWKAVRLFAISKADFADCLMLAAYKAAACSSMLTFDAKAAKLPGAELVAT